MWGPYLKVTYISDQIYFKMQQQLNYKPFEAPETKRNNIGGPALNPDEYVIILAASNLSLCFSHDSLIVSSDRKYIWNETVLCINTIYHTKIMKYTIYINTCIWYMCCTCIIIVYTCTCYLPLQMKKSSVEQITPFSPHSCLFKEWIYQ